MIKFDIPFHFPFYNGGFGMVHGAFEGVISYNFQILCIFVPED